MKVSLLHRLRIFSLMALLSITASLTFAQDSAPITVVGSGVVAPVFDALTAASGVVTNQQAEITGTRAGFERLCAGTADVALSNRSINAAESQTCATNIVDYSELWIAHDIVALVVPASATYAQCLSSAELNTIFAPSAQITRWNQLSPANFDVPINVVLPATSEPNYAILDNLVEGDGFRSGVSSAPSDVEIINTVSQSDGSIGVVGLPAALAASDRVRIVQLNATPTFGCQSPSATTVEQRTYPASSPLYIYFNRASLEKPGLRDLLTFAISTTANATVDAQGLVAPTETTVTTNQQVLTGEGNTRPFSEAATSYQIPPDASGQVRIAGAASASAYVQGITSFLTTQRQSITVDSKLRGQTNGVRRLCNGEVDIVAINQPLDADQSQNCAANNIVTLEIELGTQAAVLVANASSTHLTCLTNQQIVSAWSAASGSTIINWNQVDPAFPDQVITLLNGNPGDPSADLMMSRGGGIDTPIRDDVAESNGDPLYRAAAVANVPGSLTVMSWAEYQTVLTNNQANIQLVSVNSGGGCVAPSEATIADQSYPLTRRTSLLVNQRYLTNVAVQSFLWTIAADDNYGLLENSGFIGVDFGSLPGLRQSLQKAFSDAQTIAAEATPEATLEATPEATPAS